MAREREAGRESGKKRRVCARDYATRCDAPVGRGRGRKSCCEEGDDRGTHNCGSEGKGKRKGESQVHR